MEPTPPTPEDVTPHSKRKSPSNCKPRGKIAALPAALRHEINLKVQDGWQFGTIVRWLFTQTADRDIPDLDLKTGDSYSLVWTRLAKTQPIAEDNCRSSLSRWTRAYHQTWLWDEVEKSKSIRLIERMEQLATIANEKRHDYSQRGGALLIRSLLLSAIENARNNGSDPDQIIRLAQAWSNLR